MIITGGTDEEKKTVAIYKSCIECYLKLQRSESNECLRHGKSENWMMFWDEDQVWSKKAIHPHQL